MLPTRTHSSDEPRRAARDVISAVVDNMRRNLEPLRYSTLAPSRYLVYLHPAEYARLEGIIPIVQEQTLRALSEELESLNSQSVLRRYASRLLGQRSPTVENAGKGWHVEFFADPDGDVAEGDILVDSELLLPASPELGIGERTRRITTVRSGQHTTARVRTDDSSRETPPSRTTAQVLYEDQSGHHAYDIVKDSVTIGRGGIAYPVDIKIVSAADVSREHARIRRDPANGRFFLIDLSSLGTTLNGRHVPRGYDEVDGSKRENGIETPLPERARIGLAETVFLDFSVTR
ncbi:MAG: FHA domain-containing protein [Acidobacteriota bacterium]